ncbi:MAG: exodeoxyribonuclease III [bacterium]
MIRTLSWNVNGIRACARQGFVDLLKKSEAAIVGLQEVRATKEQVPSEILQNKNYPYQFYVEAEKKGYSGCAILSKKAPEDVLYGMQDAQFDREGRLITAVFKEVVYLSAYFPNSQEAGKRLSYKLDYCKLLHKFLKNLEKTYPSKTIVLAGDYNIAHEEIDLARPDSNHDSPGFLPEERMWMSSFLSEGWVDTFRHLHPQTVKYSWWSARTKARGRNIGWRIDYHTVNSDAKSRIAGAEIWDDVIGSDHCPVVLNLK